MISEGEDWYQNKDSQGNNTLLSKDKIKKARNYFKDNSVPSNWVDAYEIVDAVPKNKEDIIERLELIANAPNVDNGKNEDLINQLNQTLNNIKERG